MEAQFEWRSLYSEHSAPALSMRAKRLSWFGLAAMKTFPVVTGMSGSATAPDRQKAVTLAGSAPAVEGT